MYSILPNVLRKIFPIGIPNQDEHNNKNLIPNAISIRLNIYKVFYCCRVKNWALKFGVDLWEFGRHFTKMNQIQNVSRLLYVKVVRGVWIFILPLRVARERVTGPIGRTRCYKNAASSHHALRPEAPKPPIHAPPARPSYWSGDAVPAGPAGYTRDTLALYSNILTTKIINLRFIRRMNTITIILQKYWYAHIVLAINFVSQNRNVWSTSK